MDTTRFDVVIIGAGLAGLTLARQLLLNTGKRILLLEKRTEVPPSRQKVGEATVQLSGYYLSKVLDLEEQLFRDHYLKYNLRFYWPTPGRDNKFYEDYSQSYIRELSNIATFQVDRNKLEEELLRLNLCSQAFEFQPGIMNLDIRVGNSGSPHLIVYEVDGRRWEVQSDWLVDATGRAKYISRKLGLARASSIHHGSTFFWVDGLVNVEKLTGLTQRQSLIHPSRQKLGHFPAWLATNHFMGEGFWFWTIPLRGRTSLGLVYDCAKVSADEVSSPEKVISWISQKFPLFGNDLARRTIVDQGLYREYSYDCAQTISADRWALTGESGRFTDPLYSPGGDLIALHNILIADAIATDTQSSLTVKARLYELLMWAFYESYVPSFSISYDVLGSQECFALKYGWELTIYFTFYVFPFLNQVFTDSSFLVPFLDVLAHLGSINSRLQAFIADFYRWKRSEPSPQHEPVLFDFMSFEPLRKARDLLYQVGLSPQECIKALKQQMANIEKLARLSIAHVYGCVLGDGNSLPARQMAETEDMDKLHFDPDKIRREAQLLNGARESRFTRMSTDFMSPFRPQPTSPPTKEGSG